jgi:hypothetical protein
MIEVPVLPDLSPWIGFPIHDAVRPIILLDEPVRVGQGFIDSDAKLAFMAGAVEAAVELPDGVLERVTTGGSGQSSERILRITAVEAAEVEYLCDRGLRLLPAYRLTITGMLERCAVLDPGLDCWWPPRGPLAYRGRGGQRAKIEEGGMTIHFPAFGGALTQFHHAEFVEHDTCVVGYPVSTERVVPAHQAIPMIGIGAMVVGHLIAPLGGRVLLDPEGNPVAVEPVS